MPSNLTVYVHVSYMFRFFWTIIRLYIISCDISQLYICICYIQTSNEHITRIIMESIR
jgi:uncharacterized membrane protein